MIRTPWLFRLFAGPYDMLVSQEPWRAHCREMAPLVGTGRILDLGIGPGVSGIEMARVLPEARYVGVDISGPMLVRARDHVAAAGISLPLVRADALHLPFPDAAFDGATGHSFLYLTGAAREVLQEVRRVVKPGGRVAFLEPSGLSTPKRLQAIFGGLGDGPRYTLAMTLWSVVSRLHGRYSPETLAADLTSAGFTGAKVGTALRGIGLVGTAIA